MSVVKALLANMKPEELAVILGVGIRTVENWVAGKHEPSPLALREINRFLSEIKKAGPDGD